MSFDFGYYKGIEVYCCLPLDIDYCNLVDYLEYRYNFDIAGYLHYYFVDYYFYIVDQDSHYCLCYYYLSANYYLNYLYYS